MLGKHNQDPTQKTRKSIERRTKGAAIVGAIGLPAWVLGMNARAARAQPDAVGRNSTPALINKDYGQAATYEAIQQAELGPQAFIDSFDKKLAKQVGLMSSSPHFTTIKYEPLSKAWHTVVTIDYVGAPSEQYPGLYDWLAVLKRKGESVPLSVSINLGCDSKTYTGINGVYKSGYGFGQGYKAGKLMPRSMVISRDNGPEGGMQTTYFGVSSEGYPAPLLPKDGIRYSNDPDRVSDAYDDLLDLVHDIATRK